MGQRPKRDGLRAPSAGNPLGAAIPALPVWIAAYLYQNKTYRFIVNGQTGAVTGEAPLSWWKVAGVALLVALVILLIVLFTHGRQ